MARLSRGTFPSTRATAWPSRVKGRQRLQRGRTGQVVTRPVAGVSPGPQAVQHRRRRRTAPLDPVQEPAQDSLVPLVVVVGGAHRGSSARPAAPGPPGGGDHNHPGRPGGPEQHLQQDGERSPDSAQGRSSRRRPAGTPPPSAIQGCAPARARPRQGSGGTGVLPRRQGGVAGTATRPHLHPTRHPIEARLTATPKHSGQCVRAAVGFRGRPADPHGPVLLPHQALDAAPGPRTRRRAGCAQPHHQHAHTARRTGPRPRLGHGRAQRPGRPGPRLGPAARAC